MEEKDVSQLPVEQDVGDDSSLNEQDKEVMAQMGKKQRLPVRSFISYAWKVSLTLRSVASTLLPC